MRPRLSLRQPPTPPPRLLERHGSRLSIDLSAIMAGSGIRGQFEEKFKALIKDIEDEVRGVYAYEYSLGLTRI